MEHVDVAVVGGGVVGLSCARAIAQRALTVVVLERERRFGQGTSTHNSGVIHAGLYYPPGSVKARLCVRGRDLPYEFCETHRVPYRRSGKLVVAVDADEVAELDALRHPHQVLRPRAEVRGLPHRARCEPALNGRGSRHRLAGSRK